MSLDDDIRDLKRNPTLQTLDPDAIRLLAFSAETLVLAPGDILFRQGDPSDGGYIVREGTIVLTANGQETLVPPPTLLGETALISETSRPATATAREEAIVIKISRKLFNRVLREYPDTAVRMRSILAQRLVIFSRELDAVRTDALE